MTARAPTPLASAPCPALAPGEAALCVLASSSAGNCSVLLHHDRGRRRAVLIDAGLSPRRTALALARLGLRLADVADICFTHLDTDHCHPGWNRPPRDCAATFRIHRRHLGRAERAGLLHHTRTEPFEDTFTLAPCAHVRTSLFEHDHLGVAAFRFEFTPPPPENTQNTDPNAPPPVASLAYATDLGRMTEHGLRTLAGVGVLAIESNYCPQLQLASDRPDFLKRRIMTGAGHLSNEEAHDAACAIAPREHAVFLHLSRQCNRPELVAKLHEGADYARTIAHHAEPTRWVRITPTSLHATQRTPHHHRAPRAATQFALFTHATPQGAR